MQTIEAGQSTRAKRAIANALTVVKVTLWADKRYGAVDAEYYFAERGLRYDHGDTGTVRDYIPALVSVSDLGSSMRHLPALDQDQLWQRSLDITLSNDFYPGGLSESGAGRLIETLRGPSRTRRLIGAGIEVSEILIDSWPEPAAPLDLTSFAGSEHVVRFRGQVDRLGPIDEERIVLKCVNERPRMISWPHALDPIGTPPEFLGRRLPFGYGDAVYAAVPIDIGANSTLISPLTETQTFIEISDASRFPNTTSQTKIQIGKEQIGYTGCGGNVLNSVVRGISGTVAYPHNGGESVVEVQANNVWAVMGAPAWTGFHSVWARNPFNGDVVRVPWWLVPTYTQINRSAVPGFDVSTFSFTDTQLTALFEDLFAASRVTVQAEATGPTLNTITQVPTSGPGEWRDSNAGTYSVPAPEFSPPYQTAVGFAAPAGRITTQTIKVDVGGTASLAGIDIGLDGFGWLFNIPSSSTGIHSFVYAADSNGWQLRRETFPQARVYEVTRDVTYVVTPTPPAIPAAIEAAGIGYNLELFVRMAGITSPPPRGAAPLHAFDSGSWSATNCSAALDTTIKVEGASSLRLTVNESHTTIRDACDTATGWTGSASPAVDTAVKTQGTGSVKGTAPSTAFTGIVSPAFTPVDLTVAVRLIVAVDIYAHLLSATDYVTIGLGSSGTDIDVWAFTVPNDAWQTIFIDYTAAALYSFGTFNPAAWNQISFAWNNSSGVNAATVQVDNVRTFVSSCYADLTGVSSADFTADSSQYEFSLRGRQVDRRRYHAIRFAATGGIGAGNGYDLPVERTEILRERDWRKWRGVARVPVGAPGSIAAITEFRCAMDFATGNAIHGIYPWDGGLNLQTWFDGLYGRDDTQNPYIATAVGEPIYQGRDVLRHWVSDSDAGGQLYDGSLSDANLADSRISVDMRGLTDGDWGRGLAALGYHCRSNVIPIEASTGTKWKPLMATSAFLWPAPTVTLADDFETRIEAERGLEDLATRFIALIDLDVRIDDSGEAQYVEAIVVSPQRCDTLIPTAATLEAAEAQYGPLHSETWFFPGLPGSRIGSVGEYLFGSRQTVGYYASERARIAGARTVLWAGVPWYGLGGNAWALELGDTFQASLPWDLGPVSFRVIELDRSFVTRQVNIIAVEVPT